MSKNNKFDLIVAGGGLAGVCAAIASARSGLKTALIQDRPVLGGNCSSEIRVPPGGAGSSNPWAKETGIIEEILTEEKTRNHGLRDESHNSIRDLVLYEYIKREKNIVLFLNTSVRDVLMKDAKTIKSVKCSQLATEKEFVLSAKYFIDCTGDGTLGYKAKAKFRLGREAKSEFKESLAPVRADKQTMGNSLMFHAIDMGKPIPFVAPDWAEKYPTEESLFKRRHGYNVKSGYWWIEVGGKFNIIDDNEIIRDELLRHVLGVWDHIKNYGNHKAENLALDWIGMVPGKRESRRFVGDHILIEKEVKENTLFEDRIAYGGWFIDLHVMGGILAKDLPPEPLNGNEDLWNEVGVTPYSIPFRCLYSKNIDNLLFAGRNISVSHVALGTTRLMLTGAVMGQAVGTAVCLCLKHRVNPRQLYKKHISELQQGLLKQDCYIMNLKNTDSQDIALNSKVKTSSNAVLKFPEGDKSEELNNYLAQLFPVSSDRIDNIKLFLESKSDKETLIKLHLREAKNIWDLTGDKDIAHSETKISPMSSDWITFPLNISVKPHRLYFITIEPQKGIFWGYSKRVLRPVRDIPVGTVSGFRKPNWRKWRFNRVSFSMILNPASHPYDGENIINGITRPESWPNIWVSDPQKSLPQYVELNFGSERKFNTIYLTFDTNLDLIHHFTPPMFRHPECVKDYRISIWNKENWQTILTVRDNYQRRRIHKFNPVKSSKIRIEILSTNGDKQARIYEVRVY